MRLILGAAQFGMPYGLTRPADEVAQSELDTILRECAGAGVDLIDTAPAYGDSERRLGCSAVARDMAVQTKTAPDLPDGSFAALQRALACSLSRLGRTRVHSLLVHGAHHLRGKEGVRLAESLGALKAAGYVDRVGVSVYDREQLDQVLGIFAPDVVQVPVSVADQRLPASGVLGDLRRRGIVVQARSVLLQGLLLASSAQIPARLGRLAAPVERFRTRVEDREAACFGYLRDLGVVDEVVVGVHSLAQLRVLLGAWERPATGLDWGALRFADELVDARRWEAD